MELVILCAILVSLVGFSSAKKLPEYIDTCATLKDFECAAKRANVVIPIIARGDFAYGVKEMDPLYLGDIDIISGTGLTLNFKDANMTGLSNLVLNDLRIEPDKGLISAKGIISEMVLISKYKVSGRIIILPIQGEGDAKVTLKNVKTSLTFWIDTVKGDDGKDHWQITKEDLKPNIGKAEFRLDNLFNGDKTLGDNTNKMLNDMWRPVVAEVSPPIVKKVVQEIAMALNTFYSKVPVEEMTT